MDITTFIIALLQVVTWPGVVIFFFIMFRKPLPKLLEGLQIRRLKRGDLEIEFATHKYTQQYVQLKSGRETKLLEAAQDGAPATFEEDAARWTSAVVVALKYVRRRGISHPFFVVKPEDEEFADWAVKKGRLVRVPFGDDVMLP